MTWVFKPCTTLLLLSHQTCMFDICSLTIINGLFSLCTLFCALILESESIHVKTAQKFTVICYLLCGFPIKMGIFCPGGKVSTLHVNAIDFLDRKKKQSLD